MRSFLNVTKCENSLLSEKFSFLLKYNEDCTADDFSWAAITVFDHWLYETDSFKVIEEASCAEKQGWNNAIKLFLKKLVELEEPLKYKFPYYLREKYQFDGQIQTFFLLEFTGDDSEIRFDNQEKPEFKAFEWVDYEEPPIRVIYFKKLSYLKAINYFKEQVDQL